MKPFRTPVLRLAVSLLGGLLFLVSCGKEDGAARQEKTPPPRAAAKGSGELPVAAPAAGADTSEARTALVIGVGDYKDTYFQALDAPGEDARKIAGKLQSLGFEVTLKLNPGRSEMLSLTDSFGASLSRRQGVGLFYFSGHGCMKPDEADPNFLVPAGTHIGSREDLPQEAVNAQRVANRMKEAGNRLNLVFLDACRSNTLPSRSKAATGGLASMRGASGLMFFFATQPNEYALESRETRSSLFTDALLSHMATPGLSFMDMMADVTDSTERASLQLTAGDGAFKQSPFMTGTLSGRFSFVPAASAASTSPPAPSGEKPGDPLDLKWDQNDLDRMAKEPGSIWKELSLDSGSALDHAGIKKGATVSLPGGVKITLRSIPAGSFTMGSPAGEADRESVENQVRVTLTQNFWMAQTEFTQAQWKAVMGNNPSKFKGDNLPVETVSWDDVQTCIAALNTKAKLPSGWKWSLPTEAQWEYACRAGTTTVFNVGNVLTASEANFDGTHPYGTAPKGPNLPQTTVAGSYPANAWGLHDMQGNVWEWCLDSWDSSSPLPGGNDPVGSSGLLRARRGGSWGANAAQCRAANRGRLEPYSRQNFLGFRPAVVSAASR